ncbi:pseudouridine synthase [Rhodococcus globerulus]|uniref:RNA pseudouridylate synthase n=1 Tax=Rhodococcus globerulus TaxID=33008 RepID=A0ABU4BZA7_RHOGO|nr:pseudouridine synthase [Rhodococcus globerulus]MDV6269549.1 pseudouridine synthase [Rhodococcus globerulus]
MPKAPLPIRDGLGPDRLRMPRESDARTVLEFLVGEFPGEHELWNALVAAGDVVDEHGRIISSETPYQPTRFVYFYREPPPEIPVPHEIEILYSDEQILVIDKPHFLATIPRGAHIVESAVVRLRRDLHLPDLAPVHRLDRMTAGVIVFTVTPDLRRPYQELFAEQKIVKEYEAIAGFDPELTFPRIVRSRINKVHGEMTATEVEGEPNSETRVELVELLTDSAGSTLGRYRLFPKTGRTHQLRLHLNSMGIPILGDNYYPHYRPAVPGDFSTPLRLLARALEYPDPITGHTRRFVSTRALDQGL